MARYPFAESRSVIGPQTAYMYKRIFSRGYVMGGYKNSAAWNTVNMANYATETMVNRGNIMTIAGNYIDGACSPTTAYAWGLHNTASTTSVVANYMRFSTDTTCAADSGMDMKTTRTDFVSPSWPEHAAYPTGAASANTDKFDYWTETMAAAGTVGTSGFTVAYGGQIFDDERGICQVAAAYRMLVYATETWSGGSWTSTLSSYASHTKGLSTKAGHGYWWGYHVSSTDTGRRIDKQSYSTQSVTVGPSGSPGNGQVLRQANINGSASSPGNTETNNTIGQDKGYALGGYDHGTHGQNNYSQTIQVHTDVVYYVAGLNMIGHDGASSGAPSQT